MARRKAKPPQVNREGVVADLRRQADLAEESGDRISAVRAQKYAWHIERCRPYVPPLTGIPKMLLSPFAERYRSSVMLRDDVNEEIWHAKQWNETAMACGRGDFGGLHT